MREPRGIQEETKRNPRGSQEGSQEGTKREDKRGIERKPRGNQEETKKEPGGNQREPMKSRKRLGSENVMNIDGFADGNAIPDPNSEFRRKQAGGYQAGTARTRTKRKPRRNQEGTRENQ